jgi:hypothetical protein
MSTNDILIVMGPFLGFVAVMTILFGIAHYFDIRD